jgi:ABC-type branched-subunit amino acid transport system ATPase component
MKYRESQKDKTLRQRFLNDNAHASLRRIYLKEGELRGINSLDIHFDYPITAIAGKNGAGKSTILALVCCAYHNQKSGFRLPKRKLPYYTFSDFFVQHTEEVPPQGVDIRYGIAHDKWRKTENLPDGVGVGFQRRWKNQGGKWNDYADRVKRNVVFLGIERIVPHAERSQSRSYSRAFKDTQPTGWEDKVKDAVGQVLGKSYDQFRYLRHSKYSLPLVKIGKTVYSGFNMGAGENALFEIFSTIYSCGEGALLVMDEVELGLHAEAQKKFIGKLKDVCLETHTQVVCTTHSKEIFDFLPYDARYFVECVNGETRITDSISSDFAFAKMAAIQGHELDILVEDEVAKTILQSTLPAQVRSRIAITVIGSATALARQLAAIYIRGEERPTLAIFDGDQRSKEKDNKTHAEKMAEVVNADFSAWYKSRIAYLPGDTWPEIWIVQKSANCLDSISALTSSEPDVVASVLEYGLQAGKHNEFHEISRNLGLGATACLQFFATSVCQTHSADFEPLVSQITEILTQNG